MKESLLTILILFICLDGISQDTLEIYLDNNYLKTEKDSAKYFRQAIVKNDHYYLTDKFINGVTYYYGEYSSINPWIHDGKAIYYNEDGSIYAYGSYDKGTMLGEWIYHSGNAIDTVYYSYPDNNKSVNKYLNTEYHTKNEKTKALGYLIIDSLRAYVEQNFHLPGRVRDNYELSGIIINCVIGKNGEILYHRIDYPPTHQDIQSEISRLIKSFGYEADIKKPFSITVGCNFSGQKDTISDSEVFVIVEDMPEFPYKRYGNSLSDEHSSNISKHFTFV